MPHSVLLSESPAPARDDEVLPDAPLEEPANAPQDEPADVAQGNGAERTTSTKLEDLFADDDDDDEFPSSAPNTKQASSPAPEPK